MAERTRDRTSRGCVLFWREEWCLTSHSMAVRMHGETKVISQKIFRDSAWIILQNGRRNKQRRWICRHVRQIREMNQLNCWLLESIFTFCHSRTSSLLKSWSRLASVASPEPGYHHSTELAAVFARWPKSLQSLGSHPAGRSGPPLPSTRAPSRWSSIEFFSFPLHATFSHIAPIADIYYVSLFLFMTGEFFFLL